MTYDFDQFLNSIKYLDYQDAVFATSHMLSKVPEKNRKYEIAEYHSNLKGLLSWLKTGRKPKDMHEFEFEKLKSLGRNLVVKKQMKSSAMAPFAK